MTIQEQKRAAAELLRVQYGVTLKAKTRDRLTYDQLARIIAILAEKR